MMDNSQTLKNWKEARLLIEKYFDLVIENALIAIKKDSSIKDAVKNILIKLLESQPQNDTIISDADLSLFEVIKHTEEDLSGKSIGEYKLIKKIGQGGMSCVYKAKRKDTEIQKFVALKLLYSVEEELTEQLKKLFTQEQQTLSKLHHSNIISFYHGGLSQNGIPYLVMEYIDEAQTIRKFVKTNNFSTNEIVILIQQVASALEYAHQNHIIHKDIKPSNILIDQIGTPKVVDFGIASFTTKFTDSNLDFDNIFTPDYASPEQINNQQLNTTSDIFSLCAVFLELLAKKNPLPQIDINNYNPQEDTFYVSNLLKQTKLDNDLKNIIKKGMALDPKNRYQSMSALVDDLNHWKNLKPVSATKKTFFYSSRKFIQRHKALSIMTALAFFAILSGMLFALEQKKKAQFEANKAQQVTNFLLESIQASDPDLTKGKDTTVKELLLNAKIQMNKAIIDNPQLSSSLNQTIGNALFKIGEYKQAQNMLEKAIQLDKNNEAAHIDLALLYINEKLFMKAEQQIIMLNTIKKTLSTTQQRQLMRLQSLLNFNQGNFEQAQQIIEKSNKSLTLNDSIDLIKNNKILAKILNERGKINQAIKLLRQTLTVSVKHFGKLSSHSTELSHILASYLTNQKSTPWEEIQGIYQQTIKNEEQLYGKNHPIVAKTYLEFGFVLRTNGMLKQAEDSAQKAYNIAVEQFGEEHMLTAHVNVLFSQLKSLQHQLPQAIEQISSALKVYQRHYGVDHFETNQLKTTLSVYLVKDKKAQQAIKILEPLIISQTKQLGKDSKATIYSCLTFMKALNGIKNHTKAINIGEQALTISKKSLGEDIMLTIGTQAILAESYLMNENYEKAIHYSKELLERGQVKKFTVYYKKIAYTLVQAYIGNGNTNKAQILINQLMDKFYQTQKQQDPYYQKFKELNTE